MAEKLDPAAKRLRNISPGDLADAIGALEAGPSASDAEIHKLYRCHDRLLVHKQAVFDHLTGRWRDLFNISYDVLLYDLILFRGGSTVSGRRQAALRVLARSPAGLRADRHCLGGDPRRV